MKSRILFIYTVYDSHRTSQVVLVVKNPPANAGDIRDTGSIPWVGKIPLEKGMATHFGILVWRTP